MKKRLFVITTILALAAGSTPVTTYAAEMQVIKQGNGYVVLGGQGMDSLQQALDEIGAYLGSNDISCPVIPGTPDTETPEQPDEQEPEIPVQPDDSEPETPEQPDAETPEQPGTQEPEVPVQPDTQEPEIPVQPDAPDVETPEQPGTQEPDNGAEEDAVHPYVNQVVDLVNQERAKAGLSELKLDLSITAAANVRAKEIKQSFSHTRPDGSSFSTALTEQGVSYRGSGENIAWGQKSPEQVMDGWMNSDGHRANILNENFKNIGVGYYQDESGVNHWVQLFTY